MKMFIIALLFTLIGLAAGWMINDRNRAAQVSSLYVHQLFGTAGLIGQFNSNDAVYLGNSLARKECMLIEIISFREQSLRSLDKQSTEQLKNVLSYSGKECDRYSSLVNLLDEL